MRAAARYYVTMDILRRVLEDYFGYTTTFIMNVTDVDDKIIRRARLQHLLEQYLARTPDTAQVQPPDCGACPVLAFVLFWLAPSAIFKGVPLCKWC